MIAVLLNPKFPDVEAQSQEVQEAARSLALQIRILRASTERDLDTTFATLAELRAGGLLVGADPFLYSPARLHRRACGPPRHSDDL
jgi:prefoldin subunit 5